MTANTLPPRNRRLLPVDKFAGVAPQFERTDGGYYFRHHGFGPAIRVTAAERDAFVISARWSVLIHSVAMTICAVAAWLLVDRLFAGGGDTVIAIVYGIVLPPIALVLYISLKRNADTPGRALAGRPTERPAREPEPARRESYRTIITVTLFLLFLAALGTEQPPSFYIWFATVSVVGGLLQMVRRWLFDRRLTPAERERLEAIEKREADRAMARRQADPRSPWLGVLLVVLSILQIVALLGGFVAILGGVVAIGGTTVEQAAGITLAIGIIGGIVGAGFLAWGVERLGKKWTGESPSDVFNFIPAGW